jgi:alpha-ketoglutarate-dependent taurine dioxygenase
MSELKIRNIRRKSITLSSKQLVKIFLFSSKKSLPLVIEPIAPELDLIIWAKNNLDLIQNLLCKHGGILFRNFSINNLETFEQFIKSTSKQELLSYQDGSSPRTLLTNNIYTSTDYPSDQSIFLHSELSYANNYPLKIYFHCVKSAEKGGETPIADTRKVYHRLSQEICDHFTEKQVMYVRNFGDKLGISWQKAFQTSNKSEVEKYCQNNDIVMKWGNNNKLQTRQVRPAIVKHSQTKELVWFNHAAFFHILSLDPNIRESLKAEFLESEFPYNTYYGDGSEIEAETLSEIRAAYQQETVTFPWQAGDILMLDNMLTAHGRNPFIGSRKVVVGMAESINSKNNTL